MPRKKISNKGHLTGQCRELSGILCLARMERSHQMGLKDTERKPFGFMYQRPVVGKHPDLMVGHPTSTVFPTKDRNFEISQFFAKIFEKV